MADEFFPYRLELTKQAWVVSFFTLLLSVGIRVGATVVAVCGKSSLPLLQIYACSPFLQNSFTKTAPSLCSRVTVICCETDCALTAN